MIWALGALLAVAGSFLPHLLGLAMDDAWTGTLALLPGFLVLVELVERRWARARSPWIRLAEVAPFAGLALLVAARPSLALPYADRILAAGLVILALARLGALVPRLRPALGLRLGPTPPAPFFLLPLGFYLLLMPWSSTQRPPDGDEPYYLLVAHSLATDFDAELGDEYAEGASLAFLPRRLEPQPGDPTGPNGEQYSRHNVLLPLVLALPYGLFGKWGALVTMCLFTATLDWLLLRAARHVVPDRPGAALLGWALFSFTPPVLLYSHQIWAELPAALLVLVSVDVYWQRGLEPRARWRLGDVLRFGLPLVLLPLLKMRFALLALPVVGVAWWRCRGARLVLLPAVAGTGLATVGLLLTNQLLYGNPLKIYAMEDVTQTHGSLLTYARAASGLFFDSAFGLFACAPIWILLVPAFAFAAKKIPHRLLDLALVSGPYLALVASRREWYGGWSPPFRYGLGPFPLFCLALLPLLVHRRRVGARALTSGLMLATVALTAIWFAVPGWTYHLAAGSNDLVDLLQARTGLDLVRLFPSGLRPRSATWVWPAVVVPLALALWWFPRRQRGWVPWGTALLLALASTALPLARQLPTRVLELEDSFVQKTGGNLYPGLWTFDRTRLPGGWVLPEGEVLRAPVTAGGSEVEILLTYGFIENVDRRPTLEVRAGERLLATVEPIPVGELVTLDLGPFRWPAGTPLVLSVSDPPRRRPRNGFVLDRIELEWR